MPELGNRNQQGGVLQPGAGHMAIGQNVSIPIHQKADAFGAISINKGLVVPQPVIDQYKCDGVGILIGKIFKDYRVIFFLNSKVVK